MAEPLLGVLGGHLFVVWQAVMEQSADRHGRNRSALVGLLSFIVIEQGRRLSGPDHVLLVVCPVVARAIRRNSL